MAQMSTRNSPQRKQPPIPSLNDLNKQLPERMGICKKADENIRNTIEMLLKEGINPIPVFVNAISKYCSQLPPPLPPYHIQKTVHILTEFDVKVGEKSYSRCGRGKYEHIDLVRVSFVEG